MNPSAISLILFGLRRHTVIWEGNGCSSERSQWESMESFADQVLFSRHLLMFRLYELVLNTFSQRQYQFPSGNATVVLILAQLGLKLFTCLFKQMWLHSRIHGEHCDIDFDDCQDNKCRQTLHRCSERLYMHLSWRLQVKVQSECLYLK